MYLIAPADQVNGGKNLTLAVFSCSQWQAGWFNAYGVAAHNTSADIFVHLGDYVRAGLFVCPSLSRSSDNRYTSLWATGQSIPVPDRDGR